MYRSLISIKKYLSLSRLTHVPANLVRDNVLAIFPRQYYKFILRVKMALRNLLEIYIHGEYILILRNLKLLQENSNELVAKIFI